MSRATTHISSLFCDTSFFYALLDRRDRDHDTAYRLGQAIQERQISLVTTWEVVLETVTLLRYRYSYHGAMVFIDTVLPKLNVVSLTTEERAKAIRWFRKLSQDKRISLCDAISYLVITEHLEHVPCVAFDDDFRRLGLTVLDDIPDAG